MSQAGDNNSGARKPDFGATYLPTSAGVAAPPPDQAPQALDHFKRGYNERTSNREREMNGFTNPDRQLPVQENGGGGPQKWQPPAGVKSESGGGGDRPNNHYQPRHQQQRNYNSYNSNYNKHDDKQYTRSCTYLPPLNKPCILYFSLFIPSINSVGAHSFPFNPNLQPFILYRQQVRGSTWQLQQQQPLQQIKRGILHGRCRGPPLRSPCQCL